MYRLLALMLLPLPFAANAQEADCANAMTQVEMNTCADREFQQADTALNEAFTGAMTRMKALDQGAAKPGAETALRDAQRAWIGFRDKACTAEGWAYSGGTMQGMAVAGCKTRLTQDRTNDLQDTATEGG